MTQPSATTALTRLHVDLTGVPEALITSLHDLIREELAAHGLPDTTHRTQLATLTQRGEAEALHLVQDREIEIPQHAELRPPAGHEDEDGA